MSSAPAPSPNEPDASAAAELGPRRPASAGAVFWVFNRMALQGFGGVLPVAQRELVEREHWLRPEVFADRLALAQVLPGPNVVNLAWMLGDHWWGLRGALAAVAGLLTVPSVIVLALALAQLGLAQQPMVTGALRGMGAASAGLVLGTAWKLWPTLARPPLGRRHGAALALAAFVLVGLWRWPLTVVALGLGGWGMAWSWRGLRRGQAPAAVTATGVHTGHSGDTGHSGQTGPTDHGKHG